MSMLLTAALCLNSFPYTVLSMNLISLDGRLSHPLLCHSLSVLSTDLFSLSDRLSQPLQHGLCPRALTLSVSNRADLCLALLTLLSARTSSFLSADWAARLLRCLSAAVSGVDGFTGEDSTAALINTSTSPRCDSTGVYGMGLISYKKGHSQPEKQTDSIGTGLLVVVCLIGMLPIPPNTVIIPGNRFLI